jgi:heavy metal translocating P-type ATPase
MKGDAPAPQHLASAERIRAYGLTGVCTVGVFAGGVLHFLGLPGWSSILWTSATVPVLVALLFEIVSALRRGDVGLDLVAALSMSAALGFGESLAANVVALMYSGGQLLEAFAHGRARREMSALLGRVSHTAMVYRGDVLTEVSINTILPGDRLIIRKGETLPVDGHVARGKAVLDLSALTGESTPRILTVGAEGLSGSVCLGEPFDLVASRTAPESTYASIVRLVEKAQASKAPMVRMADRYAIWFLALTLAIAGLAWLHSGEPLRALSVLVVATPCPLILAVPVALMSGISRAARAGVLVKSGDALEALALVRTLVIDKTGTLTHGVASVAAVRAERGWEANEVLRLAASLDQASGHVVAATLIAEAARRQLVLSAPTLVEELAGEGLVGTVDGKRVAIGSDSYVASHLTGGRSATFAHRDTAESQVAVACDGRQIGVVELRDEIRPDAAHLLQRLRDSGIKRIVLASGDRPEIAGLIGQTLGVDMAIGGLAPAAKVDIVRDEARAGRVMMVGDGVNDAPSLAAADVGVAMGARGTVASSEAAGVVLLVDELAPLAVALQVARRARVIAVQSVIAGLGLSVAAMFLAAAGFLSPVQGALLQEVIDVAVILNALRVLR